jgi:hypothetical protein
MTAAGDRGEAQGGARAHSNASRAEMSLAAICAVWLLPVTCHRIGGADAFTRADDAHAAVASRAGVAGPTRTEAHAIWPIIAKATIAACVVGPEAAAGIQIAIARHRENIA